MGCIADSIFDGPFLFLCYLREHTTGNTSLMLATLEGDEIIVDILIACVGIYTYSMFKVLTISTYCL